jgi:hypothetical protein
MGAAFDVPGPLRSDDDGCGQGRMTWRAAHDDSERPTINIDVTIVNGEEAQTWKTPRA